jgi:hypothetical protein
VRLPAFINRLRWSRLSPLEKKLALGAGGVGVLGTILYFATRKSQGPTVAQLLAQVPSDRISYISTIKGQLAFQDAVTHLAPILGQILDGNIIIMQDAQALRRIIEHQGVGALNVVIGAFYPSGSYSTDELANQAHCQTISAQLVGLHNDWLWPFDHMVYREPDYVQPQTGVRYAGNAIPTDDPRWQEARQAAIEASVGRTMHDMDFGTAVDTYKSIISGNASPMGPLYVMQVPVETRDALARLARDMASKNNKTIPTTDSQGKPIPEPQLTMIHASVGAVIASQTIDLLEGPNSPCIRKLTPELVFSMFAATLGTVLTLAFGPALSGISVAIQIASTVNKLANLSK